MTPSSGVNIRVLWSPSMNVFQYALWTDLEFKQKHMRVGVSVCWLEHLLNYAFFMLKAPHTICLQKWIFWLGAHLYPPTLPLLPLWLLSESEEPSSAIFSPSPSSILTNCSEKLSSISSQVSPMPARGGGVCSDPVTEVVGVFGASILMLKDSWASCNENKRDPLLTHTLCAYSHSYIIIHVAVEMLLPCTIKWVSLYESTQLYQRQIVWYSMDLHESNNKRLTKILFTLLTLIGFPLLTFTSSRSHLMSFFPVWSSHVYSRVS